MAMAQEKPQESTGTQAITITNNPPAVGVPNTGMRLFTSNTGLTLAVTLLSTSRLLVLARRYGTS